MFKLKPTSDARRLIDRGDAARDRRDWEVAASEYQRALLMAPRQPAIWVQFGHALKESGRLGDAIDAYRKAIALAPEDFDAHLQLGHALKLKGDPHGAIAAYSRSVELNPGSPARQELLALTPVLPHPA